MNIEARRSLFDRRSEDDRASLLIGQETDEQLAQGFLAVGDILAQHLTENSYLVLPSLANYRHGIELALRSLFDPPLSASFAIVTLRPELGATR